MDDEFVREPRKWDAKNLTTVMYRYGPMCVVTDLISWAFFIFVVFAAIDVTLPADLVAAHPELGSVTNASDLVLGMFVLGSTEPLAEGGYAGYLVPYMVLFQSLWCIEQYWMQVWAIHIVRTNKLPFFQAWSAKPLVATTIIALIVGTALPFTGPLWEAISGCTDLIGVPLWALIFMPIIGAVYFFGAHAIKKYVLKKYGFFAC